MAISRDLKVADFVRDEVAQIIQLEMRDPRVNLVSVNDVKVSKDLSFADIYVSTLQDTSPEERAELIQVLNKAAGFFRSTLAKRHSMRTTPKPRFHYDELVESGPKMEKLIARAIETQATHDTDSEEQKDAAPTGSSSTDAVQTEQAATQPPAGDPQHG